MSFSLRPPTKRMLEKLKDCHEKINKGGKNHCVEEDLKGALAGLYRRGLVSTKFEDVNGKKILCLYVTEAGVAALNELK